MSWKVVLTKQANKDAKKLTAAGLKPQAEALLAILLLPEENTVKVLRMWSHYE